MAVPTRVDIAPSRYLIGGHPHLLTGLDDQQAYRQEVIAYLKTVPFEQQGQTILGMITGTIGAPWQTDPEKRMVLCQIATYPPPGLQFVDFPLSARPRVAEIYAEATQEYEDQLRAEGQASQVDVERQAREKAHQDWLKSLQPGTRFTYDTPTGRDPTHLTIDGWVNAINGATTFEELLTLQNQVQGMLDAGQATPEVGNYLVALINQKRLQWLWTFHKGWGEQWPGTSYYNPLPSPFASPPTTLRGNYR